MIKFEYSQNDYAGLIKSYAKIFNTRAADNTVYLPETFGKGSMKAFILSGGLQVLLSDYVLKKDLLLTQKKNKNELFLLRFEEMTVPSDSQPFSKSAVVLSTTSKDHLYLQTEGTHVKVFAMLFSKDWLQNYFNGDEGEALLKYLSVNMGVFIYEQMDAEYRLLVNEALKLHKENNLENFVIKNRAMLLAERFYTRQYMKMTDVNFSLKISTDDIAALKIVEAELIKDFYEPPDMQKLSRMAAMSTSKLKNSFKEMFGMPVYQYYQKQRMNKAKAMLLSKNYTVKQIAEELGFTAPASFAKAFQKLFGYIPQV